jgi:transcriptional regulator with XRE-family HTH domain
MTGRAKKGKPLEHVVEGEWPDGKLDTIDGEVAASIARNLREAMGGRSARSIAGAAGIAHTTVQRILSGEHWPDIASIALLEDALKAPLWPRFENEKAKRATRRR